MEANGMAMQRPVSTHPAGRCSYSSYLLSAFLSQKQIGCVSHSRAPSVGLGKRAPSLSRSHALSTPTSASSGVDALSTSGMHEGTRVSADQPWQDHPPRKQQQQQQRKQKQRQGMQGNGNGNGYHHGHGEGSGDQQPSSSGRSSSDANLDQQHQQFQWQQQQCNHSNNTRSKSSHAAATQQQLKGGTSQWRNYKKRRRLQVLKQDMQGRQQQQQQQQAQVPKRHQKHVDAALLTHYITQVTRLVPLQRLLHQCSRCMHGGHIALLLLKAVDMASTDPAGWYDGPGSPLRLYLKRLHMQRERLRHFQAQQQQQQHMNTRSRSNGSASSSSSRSSGAGRSHRSSPSPPLQSSLWGMVGEQQVGSPSPGIPGTSRRSPSTSSNGTGSSSSSVSRLRPPTKGPLEPELHMAAWLQLSTAIGRLARRAAKLAVRGQLTAEAASTILSCLAKLGWKQPFVLRPLLSACAPLMARPVSSPASHPSSSSSSSSGSSSSSKYPTPALNQKASISGSEVSASRQGGSGGGGHAPSWNGSSNISSNGSSSSGSSSKGPSIQGRPSASVALPQKSSPSFAATASLPATATASWDAASTGYGGAASVPAPQQQQRRRQRRQQQQQQPLQLEAQAGCSAVALANMLWSCVVLKERPGPGWLACADTCLQARLPGCPMPVLCTCTFALGAMRHQASPQLLEELEVHTKDRMHEGRPIDLANLASGCAGMQHRPSGPWAAAYLSAVLPKLRGYSIPELQRTLCGLAGIGCKPDDAWLSKYYNTFRAAIADAPPGTISLSVAQMGLMASALARLNCRPDISWLEECLAVSQRDLSRAGASHLVQLVSALAALRFRPGSAWMQVFLTVSFQRLAFYSPDQVVALLQAFARLGHRPQGLWLDELSSKVQARLQQFNGEQLAGMMGALARLRYAPDPDWLADFERASQSRLTTEISAGGLATIVWALAEMKHQPAPGWLYSFMLAAYRQLDMFDAMQLGIVFEALPRVSPHPSWLDELVQICATESSMRERSISSWCEEEEEEMMDWQGEGAETAAAAATAGPAEVAAWQSGEQGEKERGGGSDGNWRGRTHSSADDVSSSSAGGRSQSREVEERDVRGDVYQAEGLQEQEQGQQQGEAGAHREANRSNRNGTEQERSPPQRPQLGSRFRTVQCFVVGGGGAAEQQQQQQQQQQQRFASSPRKLRVHF